MQGVYEVKTMLRVRVRNYFPFPLNWYSAERQWWAKPQGTQCGLKQCHQTSQWPSSLLRCTHSNNRNRKSTTGCHCAPGEWLKQRRVTPLRCGEGAGKLDHSYAAGGNVKWYPCSGEHFGCFLKNKKHATVISEHLSQRNEDLVTNVHSSWNQPRCPPTGEWVGWAVAIPCHGIVLNSAKGRTSFVCLFV